MPVRPVRPNAAGTEPGSEDTVAMEERYEVDHAFGFRGEFVTTDNIMDVIPEMPPELVDKYLKRGVLRKINVPVAEPAAGEAVPETPVHRPENGH